MEEPAERQRSWYMHLKTTQLDFAIEPLAQVYAVKNHVVTLSGEVASQRDALARQGPMRI